jgi:hypothetical protein
MPKFTYLHREEAKTYVCFDLTGEYSVQYELPLGAVRYVIERSGHLEETAAGTNTCLINHGGGGPIEKTVLDAIPQSFDLEAGDEVRVGANGDLSILKQHPPSSSSSSSSSSSGYAGSSSSSSGHARKRTE